MLLDYTKYMKDNNISLIYRELLVKKDDIIANLSKVVENLSVTIHSRKILNEPIQEWHSISSIAEIKDLTTDAIRKQLQNGEFEEGVDFKKPKGRILVNQGAVERIQRKRRSSNG